MLGETLPQDSYRRQRFVTDDSEAQRAAHVEAQSTEVDLRRSSVESIDTTLGNAQFNDA